MANVLNPVLYRKLKRHCGAVRVSNGGEAFAGRRVSTADRQTRVLIEQAGEYYLVCCPYCNDTRFRLYVNHMFGKQDRTGRKMNFLAICYNEYCMAKQDNLEDFIETLSDTGPIEDVPVRKGVLLPEEAREVMWPGPYKNLTELDDDHRACGYVASRGFDPAQVGRLYGVSYCTDSHFYLARRRIIIPVFEGGKLRGWQARYVGELPWKDKSCKRNLPPKYWSCPNSKFRSRCVYNWDRMRQWQTGVVVEGPTDVWRFGAMSGCIFGNTVTDHQRRKIMAVFKKRTLVLLLDPEEYGARSTRRAVRLFEKAMPGRFCALQLPRGTDPGSLGREFLRDWVRSEAADRGVRVVYRKVK